MPESWPPQDKCDIKADGNATHIGDAIGIFIRGEFVSSAPRHLPLTARNDLLASGRALIRELGGGVQCCWMPMDNAAAYTGQLVSSTVLVVDDEPLIRAVVCEHLQDFGWRALQAGDAQEAIRIMEGNETVHLVFSHIQMPGMDGFGLLRWIKEHRPQVKVLLASGVDSVKLAGGFLGAPRWLVSKPYSMMELDARLRELL